MSEQINRVLADRPQAFTTAQQAQARANIGAAYTGDLTAYVNYSALSKDADSSITAIGGSAVGMTGVNTKSNLSGSGTTGSPLDINTSVTLATGDDSLTLNPTQMTVTSTVGTSFVNYVKHSVTDASGRSAEMLANQVMISDGSGSYRTKGVSSMRYVPTAGVSEIWYTGIGEHVDGDNPRTVYHIGSSAQQVDYSSIEKWNGYATSKLDSVSTKSNLSGNGTTASPLDLNTSLNLQSSSKSINIDPSHVQLTSQGYSEKFSGNYTVGGFSYTAQQRSNTSQSATVDLNTSHLIFEKNTADGHHSAVYSTGGTFVTVTGTASPSPVDDRTALWLGNRGVASFRGQSWSTNHTGFRLVGESGNEDTADNPRLELVNPPVGSATVDIPSVMRWNGYSSSKLDASAVAGDGTFVTSINGSAVGGGVAYSAGNYIQISSDTISVTGLQPSGAYLTTVSSNNNITGDGTTGSPVGISSSLTYTLNSISTKLYYSGLYLTGNANRQVEVRGNGIRLGHPSATSVLEASSTFIYPGSIYVGGKLSSNSATTNTEQSFSAFEATTDSNHYIGRLEPTALTMTMGWSPSTESAIMTYRTIEVRQRLDSSDTSKDRYVMLYDGRILFGNSGTYAQIRMDDIAKWNDLYTAFTSYTSTHP